MWFLSPLADAGDFHPHAAVDGARWLASSSPSLTREITARQATASGPACGLHFLLDGGVLTTAIGEWTAILGKMAEGGSLGASTSRDLAGLVRVLPFLRCFEGAEVRCSQENGAAWDTAELRLKDLE